MKPSDFKVGQVLCWVRMEQRESVARDVTVTSVGRKWVHFKTQWLTGKFDPATMKVDSERGGWGPGVIYASRTEYETEAALSLAWLKFRIDVRDMRSRPTGLTVELIGEVRRRLGMPS